MKRLVHIVNKVKLVEQMFIKVSDKSPFNMKEFLLEYVCKPLQVLLFQLIFFSNNFNYLHGWKSQNNFGSMNIKYFYENSVSLKFIYFSSKNHWEFEFFMISREISTSDFFFLQTAEENYSMRPLGEVTG